MADTTFLKKGVEPFIREALAKEFGQPFVPRFLTLSSGGTHEFDAVSEDGQIVAAIKSASGKTKGGKRPSGKIKDIEAELYYLNLVHAVAKFIALTNREFYEIITSRLHGRLAPGISLKLVELPSDIQNQVQETQKLASDEVSPNR